MRAALAAAAFGLAVAAPAHAVPATPLSPLGACRYTNPLQDQPYPLDPGRQWVVMDSEPVYVGPASAVLTCTIQVGTDVTHNGDDVVVRSSPATLGAVALPPAMAAFELTYPVSLCSAVTYENGPTYYLDDLTGLWSTDPGVSCVTPYDWGPPPPDWMALPGQAAQYLTDPLDETGCPVLASSPVLRDYDGPVWVAPDGDVWLGGIEIWECP